MTRLTALGAYIFQGGFTLGVQKHFKVLAHFEDGPFGVATVNKNMPRLPIYQTPAEWPLGAYANEVDFIYANPPCAPWSNAGSRLNRPDWRIDPLTACWRRSAKLVWELRPKIAAIESVRPIYTKGRELFENIAAEGRKHGYQAHVVLEDAIDCNLPQRRPRVMLVLARIGYTPSPTHGIDVWAADILRDLAKAKDIVPAGNRRRACETMNSFEKKILEKTPPGSRLSKQFNKMYPNAKPVDGKVKGRPSMLKFRIHPTEPTQTQTGSAILFHHKQDRYLTISEAAALCGYPFDYEFVGSISSCYAQIAKAVMPNVGEHMAKDVKIAIRKGIPVLRPDMKIALEHTVTRHTVSTREIKL